MKAKRRNGTLWMLLVLLVVVAVLIWLLPDGRGRRADRNVTDTEARAPKSGLRQDITTEPQEQEQAALIEAATLVGAGDMAPDFTVSLLDGGSRRLSDLRGKVVLLNFWATWCPPCREELARVQTELLDRFRGRDFVFLPISRGETRDEVARFRERMDYRFSMGLDPKQAIYKLYATNYIPRNFLIDRNGRVVIATTGYEPEEFDRLLTTIEKILQQ